MNKSGVYLFFIWMLVPLSACTGRGSGTSGDRKYITASEAIRDTILYWDSIYFKAVATCNGGQLEKLVYEDLEEYNDWGGVMVSKDHWLKTMRYRCGSTRERDVESSQVYPVKNFGAVHMGLHRLSKDSAGGKNKNAPWEKFIHIWRHQDNRWVLSRLITCHLKPPDAAIYFK